MGRRWLRLRSDAGRIAVAQVDGRDVSVYDNGMDLAEILGNGPPGSSPSTLAFTEADLLAGLSGLGAPAMSVMPDEVWGCGVTYPAVATSRGGEDNGSRDARMYRAASRPEARPQVFFKATASRCVGTGEAIGIRFDASCTVAEPELAVLVGPERQILGYTLCNDVTAWGIETENPLYLSQAKVFTSCCAIGPILASPESFCPEKIISTTVTRDGVVVAAEAFSTSEMTRPLQTLLQAVLAANPPAGLTLITTGTGARDIAGFPLESGDEVRITSADLGELVNTAQIIDQSGVPLRVVRRAR